MRPTRLAAALLAPLLLAPGRAAADTVTLGAVRDNTLCEDPAGASSNGAGSYLFVGRTNAGDPRRGLVAFDVSSIPPGSTVTSVTLRLVMSRTTSGAEPVSLHRASAAWGEGSSNALANEGRCAAAAAGDATWVHRVSPTDLWAQPGGDFAPAPSASASVAGTGAYTWGPTPGLAADVQAWVADPASGHGWVLIGNETAFPTTKRFDSREAINPASRPELTVEYTPPGAAATLYESPSRDPCVIIAPANAVGSGASSLQFTPGPEPLLHYQVDLDASCLTAGPALLRMVKSAGGILAVF